VLHKRKVEITEGKYLDRQPPITTTFDESAEAYFAYAVHQQGKRSWPHDRTSIRALSPYFDGKRLMDIPPALNERYRACRREIISRRGRPVTPASINGELSCLRCMFNVARKGLIVLKAGVPRENPIASVSLERETNIRDRVLSRAEFDHLMTAVLMHRRPILLMAYHAGMRQSEMLKLTWIGWICRRGSFACILKIPKPRNGGSFH
jgi:integrase